MGCGSSTPENESAPVPDPGPAQAVVPTPPVAGSTPAAAPPPKISTEEDFNRYMEFLELFGKPELERLRKGFRELDLDNSGSISMDELKVLLEKEWKGVPPSPEQVKKLMSDYDVDANGKVTFEEYVRYLLFPNWKKSKQDEEATAVAAEARAAAAAAPPAATGDLATDLRSRFTGSFKLSAKTMKLLVDYELTLEEVTEIQDDFKTVDADNSGEVSRDEVRRLLTREWKGKDVTEADVDSAMARYDDNKDGNVTFDEFVFAQCSA